MVRVGLARAVVSRRARAMRSSRSRRSVVPLACACSTTASRSCSRRSATARSTTRRPPGALTPGARAPGPARNTTTRPSPGYSTRSTWTTNRSLVATRRSGPRPGPRLSGPSSVVPPRGRRAMAAGCQPRSCSSTVRPTTDDCRPVAPRPEGMWITGELVITGIAPDGGSVRFIPSRLSTLRRLQDGDRVEPDPDDGSVQLRLDGIDAPEKAFQAEAQPLALPARREETSGPDLRRTVSRWPRTRSDDKSTSTTVVPTVRPDDPPPSAASPSPTDRPTPRRSRSCTQRPLRGRERRG